jgi:hypothetical protein
VLLLHQIWAPTFLRGCCASRASAVFFEIPPNTFFTSSARGWASVAKWFERQRKLAAPSRSFGCGSQRARDICRSPLLALALVLVDCLLGTGLFFGAGFFGFGFATGAEAGSGGAGVCYRFGAGEEGELEAALLAVDAVQDDFDLLA